MEIITWLNEMEMGTIKGGSGGTDRAGRDLQPKRRKSSGLRGRTRAVPGWDSGGRRAWPALAPPGTCGLSGNLLALFGGQPSKPGFATFAA